jgi:hypothetical protein
MGQEYKYHTYRSQKNPGHPETSNAKENAPQNPKNGRRSALVIQDGIRGAGKIAQMIQK